MIVGSNRKGAVDRKMASPPEMSPTFFASAGETLGRGRVERLIADALEEAFDRFLVLAILGKEFVQRVFGELAIARIVMLGPRRAGDRQPFGQQPVSVQPVKRRQQHALREVSRRAEQQQLAHRIAHNVSWMAMSPVRLTDASAPGQGQYAVGPAD